MNIAIFDDDREFAGRLESLVRSITHFPTSINTTNADEIGTSRTTEPVLYFLDIMKDGKTTGFDIAQRITEYDSHSLIVFMTSYPQTIISNPFFKVKSFNYICKSNPNLEQEIKETIYLAEQALTEKCLYVHVGKHESLYIPYESILYVEAVKASGKLCVHCTNGQYIFRNSLANMLARLSSHDFVQCHKSYIVNKKNIRKLDKSNRIVWFEGGVSCPYSYIMKGAVE